MTQPGGDFIPLVETINLPPMLFDGDEEAIAEALSRLAPAFQVELDAARAEEMAYSQKGPGDMDIMEWSKATPRLVVAVENAWNQRLGIVRTNNMAVQILSDTPAVGTSSRGRVLADKYISRFAPHDKHLFEASRAAYARYVESQDMTGPDADVTVTVRWWINNIYTTLLLRRFAELNATDYDILAITGQNELSAEQIAFIQQYRPER